MQNARMDIHSLWYVLAAVLIVVGFIGTILPALPGAPLVFVGMLVAAWADGFQHVGLWTLIGLGVLTVIAVAVDFLAGLAGAKRVGGGVGAAVGTIVGIFFGIAGLLLGPFLGALIGELVAGGTLKRATNVGVGAWIGFLIGTVLKLGVCFAMLGIFALAFIAG
jgi:uncharacterized protein YqgC (DUF456 family)